MNTVLDMAVIGSLREITKPDFFEKLVELFEIDASQTVTEIKMALDAEDAILLAEKAHSLKSSSSSIGAVAVSALADKLEILGLSGTTKGGSDLFSELETQILCARQALKEVSQ